MRNKEQTKRNLITTVGDIFRNEGYSGLGVNKVAKLAGVDKKLIYRYFGGLNRLVEEYIKETDYWLRFLKQFTELGASQDAGALQQLVTDILRTQFIYFAGDTEMQNLMLWELNTKSELMQSIHRTREIMGQQLLEMTDPFTTGSQVNFRAVAALLVGGIYYMVLHTRNNGSMFSDVDLSTSKGRDDILAAISFIVDSSFTTDLPVAKPNEI